MAGFWESGTDKPHTQADVDAQLGIANQARSNLATGRADSIGSGIGMVAQALAGRNAMNNAAEWAQGLQPSPVPAPSPMPSYAPPSVPMPGMQAAMAAPPAQGMMPNPSMFARMAGGR